MSRRKTLSAFASAAAIAGIKDQRLAAQSAGAPAANPAATDWAAERARVMAVGFTADEAECCELIARAAAKSFELPVLGELDKHEIAEATHVFQQKLLARPVYRNYVDAAHRAHVEYREFPRLGYCSTRHATREESVGRCGAGEFVADPDYAIVAFLEAHS